MSEKRANHFKETTKNSVFSPIPVRRFSHHSLNNRRRHSSKERSQSRERINTPVFSSPSRIRVIGPSPNSPSKFFNTRIATPIFFPSPSSPTFWNQKQQENTKEIVVIDVDALNSEKK